MSTKFVTPRQAATQLPLNSALAAATCAPSSRGAVAGGCKPANQPRPPAGPAQGWAVGCARRGRRLFADIRVRQARFLGAVITGASCRRRKGDRCRIWTRPVTPSESSPKTGMINPRHIAAGIVGAGEWQMEVSGFCRCPGKARHKPRRQEGLPWERGRGTDNLLFPRLVRGDGHENQQPTRRPE